LLIHLSYAETSAV